MGWTGDERQSEPLSLQPAANPPHKSRRRSGGRSDTAYRDKAIKSRNVRDLGSRSLWRTPNNLSANEPSGVRDSRVRHSAIGVGRGSNDHLEGMVCSLRFGDYRLSGEIVAVGG